MNTKRTILYLYAELQPYVIIVLRELAKDAAVHVVHWDKRRLTPYEPPEIENVRYYPRSRFHGVNDLVRFALEIEPAIVYTSGWMDKTYLLACCCLRKRLGIPVVAGSDTQWRGGKQHLNVLASPFLHRRAFSHIQISGVRQQEYARRLGFDNQHILLHNYSADVEKFFQIDLREKARAYPKRFLFIGRFAAVKGLRFLIEAWERVADKKGWTLTLIGNGPEKERLAGREGVELLDFMDQESLREEMRTSGCFILPSVSEPWGVALHEAAAAGLPILASNVCGAAPHLVIDGYNGWTFAPGSAAGIKQAMEKVIGSDTGTLITMSERSRVLSRRITPETVSAVFLSVVGR
jgi:glycosyltransferase involved in cell wall biosynthesis